MLLDTSGLYCYLDAADARHADAVFHVDSAEQRIVHNYVLAELVALCNSRRISRQLTLAFIEEIACSEDVQLSWVDRQDHDLAIALLAARPDKHYSLCDAVSFVLMKRHGVVEALTTDRHFEQEGFVRLLPP